MSKWVSMHWVWTCIVLYSLFIYVGVSQEQPHCCQLNYVKESAHSLPNGRRSIMFYSLHKTPHVIIGSQNHEWFMYYLLNHTCCPNTRATQKQVKVFHTNASLCAFWSPAKAYTNTHTPSVKRIRRKRNWKKKKKKWKRIQDRTLRCIAGKEIKSIHQGLWFLEIQGSVLSASFMPGQSDGGAQSTCFSRKVSKVIASKATPLPTATHMPGKQGYGWHPRWESQLLTEVSSLHSLLWDPASSWSSPLLTLGESLSEAHHSPACKASCILWCFAWVEDKRDALVTWRVEMKGSTQYC